MYPSISCIRWQQHQRQVLGAQPASVRAGKEQPRSHVVQLMQDLNVQLDNLCQVQFSSSVIAKPHTYQSASCLPVLIRPATFHK